MNRAIARRLALVITLCVVAFVPLHAADVDGKWMGSLDTPMGALPMEFNFKADGSTLSGSMVGPDGNKISFNVSIDFGGMSFDFVYTGTVSPDTLQMSSDFMGMPFMFSLKKAQ
jgi:hypothetical protein